MANPTPSDSNQAKLVSAARAIITNQIGFPVGCVRVLKILTWLNDASVEYPVFAAYASDTQGLPIGSERLLCERGALKRFDERLEGVNARYREAVLDACFHIINRFATATATGARTPQK